MSRSYDFDYMQTLTVIGNTGVGKSCLLRQFAAKEFVEEYIKTIGVDFEIKTVNVADKRIKMQMWEVAYNPGRFEGHLASYLAGTKGVAVICDVSDRNSFDQGLEFWINQIRTHARRFDKPDIIIGNKLDLIKLYAIGKDFSQDAIDLVNGYFRRYYRQIVPSCLIEMCLKYMEIPKRISNDKQISYQEAKAFADKYNVDYIETSAKTGEKVEKAMRLFAYNVHTRLHPRKAGKQPMEIKIDESRETKNTSLLHGTDKRNSHESCCNCAVL